MRILCVGMNHKTAQVALRERLAFDASALPTALGDLAARWPGGQFLILSTCNRCEVYAVRPVHDRPRAEELASWLGQFNDVPPADYDHALYTLSDRQAVGHLFEVAAGLDSLVPGEGQILTQLKDAYAASLEARSAGPVLNDLLQTALHLGKRVRSQTGLGAGKVSVASVAVECILQACPTLQDKTVLSIGAGKMNELMLRQLAERGGAGIIVTNRSPSRACELAAACGGQAVPYGELHRRLEQADVLITSTAASSAIITRKMIESAQQARAYRPMLIVDIAVPRDVEPSAAEVRNVTLRNIDDLEQAVRGTLDLRNGHRGPAQQIVDQQVGRFMDALNVRLVGPTLGELYRQMRTAADRQLEEAGKKLSTHGDSQEDLRVLRRALHRTIRQILHPAASNLRRSAGSDAARAYVSAIRKLFDLDKASKGP